MRVVHLSTLDYFQSGLVISSVAMAVALFLVWYGWARDLSYGRAFLVLLLFSLFPGAVYNFAIFPTSLALAFVLGALLCAMRKRSWFAALLMICAGLCYPSAWFASAGLAIAFPVAAWRSDRTEVAPRAFSGLLGLGSIVVLMLVSHPWNAYFLLDRQHALVAPGFPGQDFLRLVFTQATVQQRLLDQPAASILAVQGFIAIAIAGIASAVTLFATRDRGTPLSTAYPAVVGVSVVVGVLAANANAGAWNRSIVLAAPCVVSLRRLSFPALVALVLVVGVTSAVISHSFFNGTLV